MVHCNYALMVVSRRSTPLGKSDRPIQDELLTVNCESEAERFRGENRLCKKIPLSPFRPSWSSFVNEQSALQSEV